MEAWQRLRLDRAKEQDISVTHVECAEASLIFCVQGLSDDYLVEIDYDADNWPPRCTCEDNYWRPDLLCKHTLVCLRLMGMEENLLNDCWQGPEQNELYEYLSNCTRVGFSAPMHDGDKEKQYR